MVKTRITSRIISWVMLMFFSAIWLNGVLYLHVHQLNDKTIVIHAHPYNKSDDSPLQNHHHTGNELILLDIIASILFLSPEQVNYAHLIIKYPDTLQPVYEHRQIMEYVGLFNLLRGPPSVYIS